MRTTTYGPGPFGGHGRSHFTSSSFISTLVGKWQQYRRLRDIESLPYAVMKDIGFPAAENTDAK